MQSANDWFRTNYIDKIDNETYRNTTTFPIVWNLYECLWWNKNFRISNLEDHISTNFFGLIANNELISKIDDFYNRILNYQTQRQYAPSDHYHSLSAGRHNNQYDKFISISSSSNVTDKIWQLIWTAYRVRCNMFHGSKDLLDYDELMSQKNLFEIMNDFIVFLIILKQQMESEI